MGFKIVAVLSFLVFVSNLTMGEDEESEEDEVKMFGDCNDEDNWVEGGENCKKLDCGNGKTGVCQYTISLKTKIYQCYCPCETKSDCPKCQDKSKEMECNEVNKTSICMNIRGCI